jgi:hypothetical protein
VEAAVSYPERNRKSYDEQGEMKKHYDFSNAVKNPYATRLKHLPTSRGESILALRLSNLNKQEMPDTNNSIIFINYRRTDTGWPAEHLKDKLGGAFGEDRVFLDVRDIDAGDDFTSKIESQLLQAAALLVLIDKNWLFGQDKFGRRRLDKEDDWVRKEIRTALEMNDCTVIPLLLDGADLPDEDALPNDISNLVKRQKIEVRAASRETDINALISNLEKIGFRLLAHPSPTLPNSDARVKTNLRFPPRSGFMSTNATSLTNVSALFLSLKRLSEILPPDAFLYAGDASHVSAVRTESTQRVRLVMAVESAAIDWLNKAGIPTLGERLINDSIAPGDFFTHYGCFQGKGILKANNCYSAGKPIVAEARLKADLDPFVSGASLVLQAHPENYTTSSTAGELSGKQRLFLVGRITNGEFPELRAQAYLIGHLHWEGRPSTAKVIGTIRDPFGRLPWHMEVFLSNLRPFEEASNEPMASRGELMTMKSILESEVKSALAEIIGEPFVPKDSPSETSDLQTNRLWLDGQQVSAVFTFKGRGLPRPLTVANFSQHGDQISKLFTEPAELVVVQHCDKVTNHVRHHLRAFATRINQLRPFLVLDGNDTVRILRHFKKLGFS